MLSPDMLFLLPYALFILMLIFVIAGIPVAFSLVLTSMLIIFLDPRLNIWVLFQRMYYGMDSFVLLAVPLFLFAGNIMNYAKITDKLINLAKNLIGHIKGSLAHVNVLVSMFFAGVSGSSTADSSGIGTILIPAMIKEGYPKTFSVAVTAASSVMGIIIPPSINMVVWGAITSTSIAGLFLGGIIPGILIAVSQMLLNLVFVKRYNVPVHKRSSSRALLKSVKDGLFASGIPIIIIGGISFGIFTPTEAAVTAVIYALILGFVVYRELNLKMLVKASSSTIKLASLSLFALTTASIYGYLISFYEIPPKLLHGIMIENPTYLLIVITIIMLIVGTFMDSLPAMAILAPLFMPLVQKAGINRVHFGVIAVMALGVGLITPPYGLCLMISSKIADISMLKALGTTMIFVVLMVLIIILIILMPDIVLFIPNLIAPQFM